MIVLDAGVSLLLAGLAVAALVWGWLPPWLRGHQSPRTSGLLWLGMAMLILMLSAPDLLPVRAASWIQHLAIVPLLVCVVIAGALAWRDRRRTRRSGAPVT